MKSTPLQLVTARIGQNASRFASDVRSTAEALTAKPIDSEQATKVQADRLDQFKQLRSGEAGDLLASAAPFLDAVASVDGTGDELLARLGEAHASEGIAGMDARLGDLAQLTKSDLSSYVDAFIEVNHIDDASISMEDRVELGEAIRDALRVEVTTLRDVLVQAREDARANASNTTALLALVEGFQEKYGDFQPEDVLPVEVPSELEYKPDSRLWEVFSEAASTVPPEDWGKKLNYVDLNQIAWRRVEASIKMPPEALALPEIHDALGEAAKDSARSCILTKGENAGVLDTYACLQLLLGNVESAERVINHGKKVDPEPFADSSEALLAKIKSGPSTELRPAVLSLFDTGTSLDVGDISDGPRRADKLNPAHLNRFAWSIFQKNLILGIPGSFAKLDKAKQESFLRAEKAASRACFLTSASDAKILSTYACIQVVLGKVDNARMAFDHAESVDKGAAFVAKQMLKMADEGSPRFHIPFLYDC